jgi:hypothetical protein
MRPIGVAATRGVGCAGVGAVVSRPGRGDFLGRLPASLRRRDWGGEATSARSWRCRGPAGRAGGGGSAARSPVKTRAATVRAGPGGATMGRVCGGRDSNARSGAPGWWGRGCLGVVGLEQRGGTVGQAGSEFCRPAGLPERPAPVAHWPGRIGARSSGWHWRPGAAPTVRGRAGGRGWRRGGRCERRPARKRAPSPRAPHLFRRVFQRTHHPAARTPRPLQGARPRPRSPPNDPQVGGAKRGAAARVYGRSATRPLPRGAEGSPTGSGGERIQGLPDARAPPGLAAAPAGGSRAIRPMRRLRSPRAAAPARCGGARAPRRPARAAASVPRSAPHLTRTPRASAPRRRARAPQATRHSRQPP